MGDGSRRTGGWSASGWSGGRGRAASAHGRAVDEGLVIGRVPAVEARRGLVLGHGIVRRGYCRDKNDGHSFVGEVI